MDNHPIPQDITGFQFKLIGNMTVKQFIYLAVGTVIAWLFFFILPLPSLIRWPIALFAIGLGGGIAFVPIDGRPMDQMFVNLIKAILAPTQYVYDKSGGSMTPPITVQSPAIPIAAPAPQTQPQALQPDFQPTVAPLPPQPIQIPQMTPAPQLPPQQNEPQMIQPAPSPVSLGWQIDGNGNEGVKENKKIVDENNKLIKNEEKLEGEVEELKKELEESKAEETLSLGSDEGEKVHQKTEELSKMLEQTIAQKEELEKELALLKSNLTPTPRAQALTPSIATPPPQSQNIKQIPRGLEKTIGIIPAPQEPNLITGVVKDPRGNPLQNILVEVKDLEDNPVRAFKTNALGRFASATSLSNGNYVITFEDTKGQNRFDSAQIEANGGILMPLEIFSIDQREELRRELFN